ncbi:MAG: peroxiredoxin [Bradyrhizobium sp.]|uniref:peroxiredoxin n=1 Tax=Bradyrhizobium sp. TaxID=376 RepID=UPI0025C052C7|nr:peroxiredoxin [Bradyrhizobium sp.]MBI5265108.1 peroxiredoxin [Bradyrhizobium sp.]
MSKKSRKKSSKTPPSGPIRQQSTTSAKAKPGQSRRAASGKTVRQRQSAASQKTPHKQLSPAKSAAAPRQAIATGLAEGAKAPAFRLPRDGGTTVSLADYAGRKLVLFFYPRANTPGCTREAIDFTRLADAFAEAGTAVLGISADSLKAQEAFRDKHKLAVPLISDETHQMPEAYGAWGEKSMYGKTFEGIIRTTLLIRADGRIARVWRRVRVDGHADEVLAAARAI